jgi:hypothetical protein
MRLSKTNPTQGDGGHGRTSVGIGRRWVRQPQDVLLRRILFQIHLWTGILIGLYIVVICLSGSVLVYRNELYRAFSPNLFRLKVVLWNFTACSTALCTQPAPLFVRWIPKSYI